MTKPEELNSDEVADSLGKPGTILRQQEHCPHPREVTEPYLWARGRGKAGGKRLIVEAGLTVGGREI